MDGIWMVYLRMLPLSMKRRKYKIYAEAEFVIKGEGASEAGSWEYSMNGTVDIDPLGGEIRISLETSSFNFHMNGIDSINA